jgi:hypothetical protein
MQPPQLRKGEISMEATILRRDFENLGLQFLFAPIRTMLADEEQSHLLRLTSKERQLLTDFGKFLEEALRGLNLVVERKHLGFSSLATLVDSAKAESAYFAIRPLLPRRPDRAKTFLRELKTIRAQMFKRRVVHDADREKLDSFCRSVLVHLHQERFERQRDIQNLWP